MHEYVIMAGTNIIGTVKARSIKSASQKALERLGEEYKKIHNVKIMKIAGILSRGN